MDFLLPDDGTMQIMCEEYAKLKNNDNARAFALSENSEAPDKTGNFPIAVERDESAGNRTYISAMLLLLYFVKHLGYNVSHGTEIFDTDRSLEQLRRVGSNFGQLNNLG